MLLSGNMQPLRGIVAMDFWSTAKPTFSEFFASSPRAGLELRREGSRLICASLGAESGKSVVRSSEAISLCYPLEPGDVCT